MTNQNVINQLVELAAHKRDLMKILERNGEKTLAMDFWHESQGVIASIAIVAGCEWIDALDMVIQWELDHE